MNFREFFLHRFETNLIYDVTKFSNKFNTILRHGLISYNYYNSIKNSTQIYYEQETHPNIKGYSRNCVSLLDPQSKMGSDIRCYFLDADMLGAYVLLKRNWVEKNLDTTEYIIPGEVKIRDNIPTTEFTGFAFGEALINDPIFLPLIRENLKDHGLEYLSLCKIYENMSPDNNDFLLEEISVR